MPLFMGQFLRNQRHLSLIEACVTDVAMISTWTISGNAARRIAISDQVLDPDVLSNLQARCA